MKLVGPPATLLLALSDRGGEFPLRELLDEADALRLMPGVDAVYRIGALGNLLELRALHLAVDDRHCPSELLVRSGKRPHASRERRRPRTAIPGSGAPAVGLSGPAARMMRALEERGGEQPLDELLEQPIAGRLSPDRDTWYLRRFRIATLGNLLEVYRVHLAVAHHEDRAALLVRLGRRPHATHYRRTPRRIDTRGDGTLPVALRTAAPADPRAEPITAPQPPHDPHPVRQCMTLTRTPGIPDPTRAASRGDRTP